jgi:predicted glycoside hydrolase/deacetylase ChbG (UPF0249 family)
VTAFADLMDFGLLSSGSLMVPCPWFPAAAAWCRDHRSADVGIHLTLTSEWRSYRWRPVSTSSSASGLMDDEGYLHRRREGVWNNAIPRVIDEEMGAQIAIALGAGIVPTHIDCHMPVVMSAMLMPYYVRLGLKHRLAPLILRNGFRPWGLGDTPEGLIEQCEELGLPIFDGVCTMGLNRPEEHSCERVIKAFEKMKAGLTCFILHPARDTPELRAIAEDWRCRVEDYRVFLSPTLRDHIRGSGIQVIGYRELLRAMPETIPMPPPGDST